MRCIPTIVLLLCWTTLAVFVCKAQPAPACNVLVTEENRQRINGSRLCVKFEIKDGRISVDRTSSRFVPSDEFTRRLKISPVQAEAIVFETLQKLLNKVEKPYRLALSDADRAKDDQGQLNDAPTNAIRTANKPWSEYLQQFDQWTTDTGKELGVGDIFPEEEAIAPGGLLSPLSTAQEDTASLIYEEPGYEAEEGVIKFAVADPIADFANPGQATIRFPDMDEGSKKEKRTRRIIELLQPLQGQPRCLECMSSRLVAFYRRLSLDPVLTFENRHTSPIIISIVESSRIVGASWMSLKNDDPNVDKLLYSLLTESAFRLFLKHRTEIKTQKIFNYQARTGHPGPYLNQQRLQIQQLLVHQLGYSVSITRAAGQIGSTSNFNLTIEKLSDGDNGPDRSQPETTNQTPESAPATANDEGVVTAHEQEKEAQTEFNTKAKPAATPKPEKDKKRYIGGGLEFRPGQGVKFFGLGQVSRFPLFPDSINNFSVKAGGQATDGALGNTNYFSDYLFFNRLHRRVSVQLTISSDLDADRQLVRPATDERRRTGFARIELEPFRDWSGSLLRFFTEGRHETVALTPSLEPTTKANLTTVEFGATYLFESIQVERPRRARFEPKIKFGLGLSAGEPRYNKLLVTGNFHQMLRSRHELDISGRVELASAHAPIFELPSLGGAEVLRGFRHDDGLGRKLWSLQNEIWIPLSVGNELSTGLKAMIREKVKVAALFDVGGLYQPINVKPGVRAATGLGLRLIYNPIIFKFDYAYGFGEKATGGSRGKFHFGIVSNLPF
jgi:Omp85 superfamily domain